LVLPPRETSRSGICAASDVITLRQGDLQVIIDPALGGALLAFCQDTEKGQVDWLRRAPSGCNDVLQSAGYPLIPYSGRIDHGRFDWRGRTVTLPQNFLPEPHSIHGHGWQNAWTIEATSDEHVALTYGHRKDFWPWDYTARQTLRLTQSALHITVSVENNSADPMPAGLGFHPFFPRTAQTSMKTGVRAIQLNDADGLPKAQSTEHVAISLFGRGGLLPGGLDNAFADWQGRAEICWSNENRRLVLSAEPPLRHLVVYVPEDTGFFCAEPVSHLSGGLNLDPDGQHNSGIVELLPGARLKGQITFSIAF